MLTLSNLKDLRVAKHTRRVYLENLCGISQDRIRSLELGLSEPWYHEARTLARTLNCTILGLITVSGSLTQAVDRGDDLPHDLAVWRSGVRVPLSLAARVAVMLGLTEFEDLEVGALDRQIWDVVESNERHPTALGFCPWCAADVLEGDHLPTCLPNNLYGMNAADVLGASGPAAVTPKRRGRVPGIKAHGLKALREARRMTQKEVGALIGIGSNYYARLERGDVPLNTGHADVLAAYYGVAREVVYAEPGA